MLRWQIQEVFTSVSVHASLNLLSELQRRRCVAATFHAFNDELFICYTRTVSQLASNNKISKKSNKSYKYVMSVRIMYDVDRW